MEQSLKTKNRQIFIYLVNCNLNDETLKMFVKCIFPSLKHLDFRLNHSSDKSSEIIVEQNCQKLSKIDFVFVKAKEFDPMSRVVFLYISKNKVKKLGFRATENGNTFPPKIMNTAFDLSISSF